MADQDTRFPPLPSSSFPSALAPYNQAEHERLAAQMMGPNGSTYTYARSDGAMLGPFPFLRESRGAGQHFQLCLQETMQFVPMDVLPLDARETAIITVTARFGAGFAVYAHVRTAWKKAGLTQAQAETLGKGVKPDGLNHRCGVAYEVAKHLVDVKGPLPKDLWERAVEAFGRDGVIALVNFVGIYAYTSVILNAADAGVPDDA